MKDLYVNDNYSGDGQRLQKLRDIRKGLEESNRELDEKAKLAPVLEKKIAKLMECLEVFAWEPEKKARPKP
jgi:hypothetical protein